MATSAAPRHWFATGKPECYVSYAMNELNIKLIQTPKGCVKKYITVEIDGVDFLDSAEELSDSIVYFKDLHESSTQEGKFLIFNCECGVADCGGWDLVEINHTESTVSWTFDYVQHYEFIFEKSAYQKEIEKFKLFLERDHQDYLKSEYAIKPEEYDGT